MSRGPCFKALVNILPSARGPIQGRMPDPSKLFTSAGKAKQGSCFTGWAFQVLEGQLVGPGGREAGLSPGLIITLRSLLMCLEQVLRQCEISLHLSVKGCGSEQSVHCCPEATLSAELGAWRPHRPVTQGGPRHRICCTFHKNDFPGPREGQP